MDRLELAQELARLPEGDFTFVQQVAHTLRGEHPTESKVFHSAPRKKAGRPKGSKNKPKTLYMDFEKSDFGAK